MPRISLDDNEPDEKPVRHNATRSAQSVIELKPEANGQEKTVEPGADSKSSASLTDQELKERSGSSILAAFDAFPRDITFSDKEEDENIILLLRAHIVTNLPWLVITAGLLLFPLLILPLIRASGASLPFGTTVALVLFWYLGTFTYAFINSLYWYFNVYILTDERVVDVDWLSIIYRKVSSAQISHVEDVSASQGGVFAGVFDYGNVQIQTAAEEENFEFVAVPHPQLVAKKISELMEKEEKQHEKG